MKNMNRVRHESPLDDDPEYAEAIRLSLEDAKSTSGAGPSRLSNAQSSSEEADLTKTLDGLDSEITDVQRRIKELQALSKELTLERRKTAQLLEVVRQRSSGADPTGKGKGKAADRLGLLDYSQDFEWTPLLVSKLKSVFKINNFRLCQEAVCNANMDGRDIVCVMPTGGGKSLTYQLPAIVTLGVTLVVSPLISLMHDQVLHLREIGVEAEVLASYLTKQERNDVRSRLKAAAQTRRSEDGLKLCYLAPEQLKNNTLMSLLMQLYEAKRLARFIIDEAHCVSTLGHDFRPEYKNLTTLRKVFPNVPILALSATCPPRVLEDLTKVLHLKRIMPGKAADPRIGTVYFSSPLYRKNLHYQVLPKPSSKDGVVKAMVEYIQTHHANESGIIYCLSKKDAEQVAEAVRQESGGKIKTGVYHADVHDKQKMDLHEDWRRGKIKVVCATIAFGLGIDKGDVRFVLHHTMSKTVDGFYQESGRAGRDGKDADCVLYYRPQDGSRLSTLTHSGRVDQAEIEKVYKMLQFAQDVVRCRKILFAEYFQLSSQVGINAWSTEEENGDKDCGHCDNCTRDPESIDRRDVTLASWQILKVSQAIENANGRVTLAQLVTIACGGKGQYSIVGAGRKSMSASLDVDQVAGGRVDLSKDDTEILCTHLLTQGYLKEVIVPTAYTYNSYLAPSATAARLTRFTREEVVSGARVPHFQVTFLVAASKRKKATGKAVKPRKKQQELSTLSDIELTPVSTDKKPLDLDLDDGVYAIDEESLSDRISGTALTGETSWTSIISDDEDEDEGMLEWETSLRRSSGGLKHGRSDATSSRSAKRLKTNKGKSKARSPSVIELSSD